MPLKGFAQFQRKAPAFAGKRFAILILLILLMLALGLSWMSWIYRLPGTLQPPQNTSFLAGLSPLFGYLMLGLVGFSGASQMWLWRKRLKKRYGAGSYQRILPVGLGGTILVASLGLSLFLPLFLNLPGLWKNSSLAVMITPLDTLLGLSAWIGALVRGLLALVLTLLGLGMAIRSVTTFGFDYMTVVYLYFPEESQVQSHAIYSALRNPMYAGMLVVGLGGAFAACTLYSFLLFALFLLMFYLFVHFVEEPELVERFGESFNDYRTKTPMFFVSPRNLPVLLRFILNQERKSF